MPWIVYRKAGAFPNERCTTQAGGFVVNVPRRVDSDLALAVFGKITAAGCFERNPNFFPAIDPEIEAVIEARKAAAVPTSMAGPPEAPLECANPTGEVGFFRDAWGKAISPPPVEEGLDTDEAPDDGDSIISEEVDLA